MRTSAASTLVLRFARFWAANMDLIHQRGHDWPGFGYGEEEKHQMHDLAIKTVATYLGPVVTGLSTLYYYAGRVGRQTGS